MPQERELYAEHLEIVLARADAALAATGMDHLVIGSGPEPLQFLDDLHYPFKVNPYFKHWVPLTEVPYSWIAYRPGQRPRLIYFRPRDFWHLPPPAPAGVWVEHFDLHVITAAEQAAELLPPPGPRTAVVDPGSGLSGYAPHWPAELLARLDYDRGRKTAWELELMRQASLRAARAHLAAEQAFRAGASEFEIHQAYLRAAGHAEHQTPYGNIIALNQHGAVLHYMHFDHTPPLQHLSLLIDAGAQVHGYAADVTRTHAARPGFFWDLIAAVEQAQQRLCQQVRPGVAFPELHQAAQVEIGKILIEAGLVRCSVEAAVEGGITRAFFPHGLGHFLGAQVHDVGGRQAGPTGGEIPRPPRDPFLRCTRVLEPDQVVTIEPGIYFIEALLEELAAGPHAGDVAWSEVDALKHYGGIRIEDDVRVTTAEPENLTRQAFAALAA